MQSKVSCHRGAGRYLAVCKDGRLLEHRAADQFLPREAAGGAFNGAGSVGVQNTHDTVSAVVEQSNLVTPALDIEATTGSRDVNITGQVSGGKNGGGLAVTVNTLHNVTRANLLSSNVSGGEEEENKSFYNTQEVLSIFKCVNELNKNNVEFKKELSV